MKTKIIFFAIIIIIAIILAVVFLRGGVNSSVDLTKEYNLTIISNVGDKIDLYKYTNYNLSHQGEEIFYLKEVNEDGKLSVKLPVGKYTIFARCVELGCQRSFDGPEVIILDKDMTVILEWRPEY